VLINIRWKALPEERFGMCGADERAMEALVPEMLHILVLEDSELLECSRYQEIRPVT
jgi:hypothetical protein